jgi:hypothetical protein
MIKFFRKIRQKSLTENKFSKYLIYAIGEIVLVVIGILIALQINNWNELQKKSNLRNEYMTSLKVDLTKDTIQLNDRVNKNIEALKEIISFKNRVNNGDITTLDDFEMFYRNYSPGPINITNTYNTNTFNILVYSGNIDLFDSQLREQIMELNRLQNSESLVSTFNKEYFFNVVQNILKKYPSINKSFNEEVINKLWEKEKKDDLPKDLIVAFGQLEYTINRYLVLTKDVLLQTELVLKQLQNTK